MGNVSMNIKGIQSTALCPSAQHLPGGSRQGPTLLCLQGILIIPPQLMP